MDEMGATPPEDEETNVALFRQAAEILFRDMPTIPMVQAPALVPFSSSYWEGWPSAANPWNMPVSWWATFNIVITGYPDPETGEWVGGIHPAGSLVNLSVVGANRWVRPYLPFVSIAPG
ncbi:MAG: hypothetical protein M5R40_10265 [Anaerolineae bacterium]|nr:hypothetical protein [Anaerolineae bacterium]